MKIVVLILLMPLHLFAQDFTGIWTGYLTIEDTRLEDTRVPYELVLSFSSGENDLEGYSLTVFSIDGNEHTGIKTIKTRSKKDVLAIEDDELIYNDYTMGSKKVRLYGKLSFEEGSLTILRGTFFTRSVDRTSFHGTIYLEKKDNLTKTKLISYLEKMDRSTGLSFRKPKTIEQDGKITASNERIKDSLPVSGTALQEEAKTAISKEPGELVSLPVQKKPLTPSPQPVKVNQTVIKPLETAIGQQEKIVTSNERIKDSLPNGSALQEEVKTILPKDRGELVSLPVQKKPVTTPQPVNVNKTVIKSFEAATELASRKTEILRSIYFESDSLVLSLYDNGEIDGDTVSVLVNDQIVIARRGLTGSAIRTTVYIPAGSDSLQVIMYAENLGRIAPNTGLLIIEDGAEKYQVRFEGDFKRNSAVIFRRKR